MEDIFNFKKPARPCGVFNIPFEQSKELITVIENTLSKRHVVIEAFYL